MQPKPKIDPDAVYVAWTNAGVAYEEAPLGVIRKGQEFRGSSLAVQNHPEYFVLADTPRSEWPSEFQALPHPAEDVPTTQVLEPLPADQLKEATVGLRIGLGGYIAKGTRLPKDHPAVVANPQYFRHVVE